MHPQNEDFRGILSFVESDRGSSRKLLERIEILEIVTRLFGKVPDAILKGFGLRGKNAKNAIFHHLYSISWLVRVQKKLSR